MLQNEWVVKGASVARPALLTRLSYLSPPQFRGGSDSSRRSKDSGLPPPAYPF